jgi:hypothetical protein
MWARVYRDLFGPCFYVRLVLLAGSLRAVLLFSRISPFVSPQMFTYGPRLTALAFSSLVDTTQEPSLDPNEFPALGSASAPNSSANPNANQSSTTNTPASYASQTIGGLASAAVHGGGATSGQGFTESDFPALGGAGSNANNNAASTNAGASAAGGGTTSPPPGLPAQGQAPGQGAGAGAGTTPGSLSVGMNGYSHPNPQTEQHRQNLLGTLQSGVAGFSQVSISQWPRSFSFLFFSFVIHYLLDLFPIRRRSSISCAAGINLHRLASSMPQAPPLTRSLALSVPLSTSFVSFVELDQRTVLTPLPLV